MLSWRHQISWLRAPLMSLCELHVLVYSRCAVTLLQRLLYIATCPCGTFNKTKWAKQVRKLDLVDEV